MQMEREGDEDGDHGEPWREAGTEPGPLRNQQGRQVLCEACRRTLNFIQRALGSRSASLLYQTVSHLPGAHAPPPNAFRQACVYVRWGWAGNGRSYAKESLPSSRCTAMARPELEPASDPGVGRELNPAVLGRVDHLLLPGHTASGHRAPERPGYSKRGGTHLSRFTCIYFSLRGREELPLSPIF